MRRFLRRRWRRSSLVVATCAALLAGCALASSRPLVYGWLLWPAALAAVLTVRQHGLPLLVCLAVLGFGLGWWRGTAVARQLQGYVQLQHQRVVVQGRATEDGVYAEHSQLAFGLDNLQVVRPMLEGLPGSLQIKGFGADTVYRGDSVLVSGSLYPTRGNHQASISFATIQVVRSQPSVVDRLRRKFAAGLESALPEPLASFGLGLLIGQRSTLPPGVAQTLLMAGLTHIIAVSGYNLTIIVEAARRLFGARSKFQTAAVCLLLIGTFLLVSGTSPSIVRASVISLLSLGAWYYGRAIKPLALLLTAGALTVLANPLYIWGNVSWGLSFLAFFGVVVLGPLITQRLYGERRPRLVVQVIIESLCAEVMTLPYVLYIFGQMSLVALPSNILIVALVPLAMLLCTVAGLAGMLVSAMAGWLAWPAERLLSYMLHLAAVLSRAPHAFVEHIGFSLAMLLASYGVVAAVALLLYGRQRPKYAIITEKKTGDEA